eukprot:s3064_g2.t1
MRSAIAAIARGRGQSYLKRWWAPQEPASPLVKGRICTAGLRAAWSGAFSTDALEDDEKQRQRHRNIIAEPSIWRQPRQPLPHQVPPQQGQLHTTLELLQAELQPGRGRLLLPFYLTVFLRLSRTSTAASSRVEEGQKREGGDGVRPGPIVTDGVVHVKDTTPLGEVPLAESNAEPLKADSGHASVCSLESIQWEKVAKPARWKIGQSFQSLEKQEPIGWIHVPQFLLVQVRHWADWPRTVFRAMPKNKKKASKEEKAKEDEEEEEEEAEDAQLESEVKEAEKKTEVKEEVKEEVKNEGKEEEVDGAKGYPSESAEAAPKAPKPFHIEFKLHDSYPPMESAVNVVYCPLCTLPPDFCQYGPMWEKCKPWCLENAPHYYPELSGVSLEDAKKKAEEVSEKSKEKLLPGGKVKRAKSPHVTIRKLNRGGRKCVTSVAGLDLFSIKLDDVAKLFKKKFACGCSVVKGENTLPDTVDIQGEVPVAQEVKNIFSESSGKFRKYCYSQQHAVHTAYAHHISPYPPNSTYIASQNPEAT